MSQLKLSNISPPSAPTAGQVSVYVNADQLYYMDSSGTSTGPLGAGGGGSPTGPAGGDLGGNYPNPDVVALQGNPVSSTVPSANDVLTFDGTDWVPQAPVSGGGITASNILYVETSGNGGNDGTGTRGDSTKPFSTLSAALAAATDGDIIKLGSGLFVGPPNGLISNSNPTLSDITVIGSGKNNTIISDAGPFPGPIFKFQYGGVGGDLVKWGRFVLRNLALRSTGGATYPIQVDGSGFGADNYFPYPTDTNERGFYLYDVDFTNVGINGGIQINSAGCVRFERVVEPLLAFNMSLLVYNVANAVIRNCSISNVLGSFDFGAAGAPAAPPSAKPMLFDSCVFKSAAVAEQSQCEYINCTIENFNLSLLTVGPGGEVLNLKVKGGSVDNIDFSTTPIPDNGAVQFLTDFSGVSIIDATFEVAAPAANRQRVYLRGCNLAQVLTAGPGVDVDAKTTMFSESPATAFVTSGTGAIRPPMFNVAEVVNAFPLATTIPFGFNLYLPYSYSFAVECDVAASGPWAVTTKGTSSVQVTASAGLGKIGGTVIVN